MTTERRSLATHSEGPYETALREVIRGVIRDDVTMASGDDNAKLLDTDNHSTWQIPPKNVALRVAQRCV